MASADPAEEFVNVPKRKYQKAVGAILQQRELIKQQELKLTASRNLFTLLQTKDNELRRSKETEASLRVALSRSEARLQKILAENFFGKSKLPTSGAKSRLEADSAPLDDCGDLEADCAVPAHKSLVSSMPHDVKQALLISKTSKEPSPVCVSQTQPLSNLPSMTGGSSLHSRNPVSKDLVDKVMQQNARLKKSIREILQQKGLTVSDYLDKREYEDVAAMLREDVKMMKNRVDHLMHIIENRNNGEVDELSKKCAELVNKNAELEHKIAVQKVLISGAYDSQKTASVSTSDRSTSPVSSSLSTSCHDEQMNQLKDRIVTLLVEKQSLEDEVERLRSEKQTLVKDLERLQSEKQTLLKDHQEFVRNQEKLLKELDAFKQQSDRQQESFVLMVAEKQALQSQLAAFEEDFNIERKEKLELKENFDRSIAQHQEWIRRLANEAQKWRTSCEAERTAKEELQSRISLPPSAPVYMLGCASEIRSSSPGSLQLPTAVCADGEPSSKDFTCPRCERKFSSKDKEKYMQHCMRCTDE